MALQPRSCIGVLPVNRRAKDGYQEFVLCAAFAGRVVGVGRVVVAGARQPHRVAVADRVGGVVVGAGSSHGDDLVASPRRAARLRRLLLLPGQPGTQDRTAGDAVVSTAAVEAAVGGADRAGARRHADAALWAEG